MEKYRVYFKGKNGKRYYIDCNSMAEVKAVITEEENTGSTHLDTEETKKGSVVGAIGFFTVGVIGLSVGNIGFFALCSVMAWATLTADIRGKIVKLFRLEA